MRRAFALFNKLCKSSSHGSPMFIGVGGVADA